jgi:hypothetical protein
MALSEAYDLLKKVERLDPRKAGNLVEKWLTSRDFLHRYAAMGVWDVVMSSGVTQYVGVFDFLGPDVANAARKGVTDEEWEGTEAEDWVSRYARGKPTGKIKGVRFQPRTLGATWYLNVSTVTTDYGEVEIEAEVKNRWTGEAKLIVTEIHDPDLENFTVTWAETEDHGGERSKQQSVLVTAYDADDPDYMAQIQLEIDGDTGEWDERVNQRREWEQG